MKPQTTVWKSLFNMFNSSDVCYYSWINFFFLTRPFPAINSLFTILFSPVPFYLWSASGTPRALRPGAAASRPNRFPRAPCTFLPVRARLRTGARVRTPSSTPARPCRLPLQRRASCLLDGCRKEYNLRENVKNKKETYDFETSPRTASEILW